MPMNQKSLQRVLISPVQSGTPFEITMPPQVILRSQSLQKSLCCFLSWPTSFSLCPNAYFPVKSISHLILFFRERTCSIQKAFNSFNEDHLCVHWFGVGGRGKVCMQTKELHNIIVQRPLYSATWVYFSLDLAIATLAQKGYVPSTF